MSLGPRFNLSRKCVFAVLLSSAAVYAQQAMRSDVAATDAGQSRTASSYCSLNGKVATPDGQALSGATVQLAGPLDLKREATTDEEGNFAITGLQPGMYTATVSLDGFTPVTGSVRLSTDSNAATATFALRAAVSTSVNVSASDKDVAEAQMQLAEQQRVAGVIPNFFVSYVWHANSLTSGEKFRLAFKSAADPGNLFLVGTVAGVQQARNTFPGYSQGWEGYGRRYGADLGNLVSGTFMSGAILPSIFRQDPRYFYKETGSTPSRFWYAVSRVVVTRGDNGHAQPNFSTVLGDMSAGAISNLYYAPSDRKSARLTVTNGLLGLAGDAMNNVFQEFLLKHLTTNSQRNSLR